MTDRKLNDLFMEWERDEKFVDHLSRRELEGSEVHGALIPEYLDRIAIAKKRIVRALFKRGSEGIAEVDGLVLSGLMTRFTIALAFGRETGGIAPKGTFSKFAHSSILN